MGPKNIPDTASPLEKIIARWQCFATEKQDDDPVIKAVLVSHEDNGLDHAFERFAQQTSDCGQALPIFITLPGQKFPANFPPKFALSVFELGELGKRVEELRSGFSEEAEHTRRTDWWLLEECFPKSFARYWFGKRSKPISEADTAIWERVKRLNGALGLDGFEENQTEETQIEKAKNEWEYLIGDENAAREQSVDVVMALESLEAILELRAKPDVLFLDDLVGRSKDLARSAHANFKKKLDSFGEIFTVLAPVLPVQQRHAEYPDELLPIIRAEIDRLSRPLAAVVDMNWLFADTGGRHPLFGLELIRLIRQVKPNLPVFVWSPINDKQTLQRTMQIGAANYFDKEPALSFGHEEFISDEDSDRTDIRSAEETLQSMKEEDQRRKLKKQQNRRLTPGKLWFHILEWENTRYRMPPVEKCGESFLLCETRESKENRRKFLEIFNLTESDLLAEREPEVERLLRALIPDAAQIEIVRFFGEGMSGAGQPFVVRGKTRSGRWLRPVQIKLSRDWRALARERKGYRDVFVGALGPSVAHVESGPYRIGEWCGMCQSFAAPEEAIREIGTKSTRSMSEWLRKNLWKPEVCRELVDEVFDGVLDPFYRGNLTKNEESVVKAFERVAPAHLEAVFTPFSQQCEGGLEIDVTPDELSRQNEKARREMAYRRWRKAEGWYTEKPFSEKRKLVVHGLVIDTLEINQSVPSNSRMRLLDRTLGLKVDLTAGIIEIARRWEALAKSPIKLRGLPVSFVLDREKIISDRKQATDTSTRLLDGWERAITKRTREAELDASGSQLKLEITNETNESEAKPLGTPGKPVGSGVYFYPWHPLDWAEEFHVGPTHGDLNLGNILLHEKEESYFPWLIDFDKAEENRPVVFDLAKLEIEAYHKIGHELYWELIELNSISHDELVELIRDFERSLESEGIENVQHLWKRLEKEKAVPESLKLRFGGFFAYLKQIHKRVEKLGIQRREFLIGRTLYCFCCIKFKHLYEAKTHPNAPFPAQVLIWKLDSLSHALDAENGIIWKRDPGDRQSKQKTAICDLVNAVRSARFVGGNASLHEIISLRFDQKPMKELTTLPNYGGNDKLAGDADWQIVFRLLRDRQLAGKALWFRELVWYARDYGVAKESKELAQFTVDMLRASMKTGTQIKLNKNLTDFASTGRAGNDYPTSALFKQLADAARPQFVKMSTRGDSGGTIDILERAGVPLCESGELVKRELDKRGWALATPSSDLCEVDKLLWNVRKAANCMKVPDLVIASISSKKIAVGIGDFAVQIVSGYDSKLPDFPKIKGKAGKIETVEAWWKEVWHEIHVILGTPNINPQYVRVAEPTNGFNSDDFLAWFRPERGHQVVFGSALLAAEIWRRMSNDAKARLRVRMPTEFSIKMDQRKGILEILDEIGKKQDSSFALRRDFISLKQINSITHLSGVRCWRIEDFDNRLEELRDITLVMFNFEHDVLELVRVPIFDELYSEMAKSGNSLASIVFAQKWIAFLRPKSEVPSDLHAWCWRILRDAFKVKEIA